MPERSVGPPFDVLLVEYNPDDVRLVEWAFSNMGDPTPTLSHRASIPLQPAHVLLSTIYPP